MNTLYERFVSTIENRVSPLAGRIGQQKYVQAIRDGFIAALPFMIVGSFMLVPYPPTGFLPPDDLSQTQVYSSLPPGSTFILGLPLVFVAWQMAMSPGGRVFFPRVVSDYGVEPQTFEAIVKRLVPWMRWAEKLVIPRFWLFESRFAERVIGVLALILAIVVFLPIPLGNWPPAFALALLGFAHSQRDGLGVVAGEQAGVFIAQRHHHRTGQRGHVHQIGFLHGLCWRKLDRRRRAGPGRKPARCRENQPADFPA